MNDIENEIENRLQQDGAAWRETVRASSDLRSALRSRSASASRNATLQSFTAVILVAITGIAVLVAYTEGPRHRGAGDATNAVLQTQVTTTQPSTPRQAITGDPPTTATGSPSPGLTPTVEPSPLPTSPIAGWLSLGPGVGASWAPDSNLVAVGTGQDTLIFDRSGEIVQTFAGADQSQWVDDETLLLRDLDDVPIELAEGSEQGDIYRATLSPLAVEPIGRHDGEALSSGQGEVSFGSPAGTGTFAVWSDDFGWTDTYSGYPVAWSTDGSTLALIHLIEQRAGLAGNLDVIAWPSRTPVAFNETHLVSPGTVRFSPTGRYLAFTSLAVTQLIDLESQMIREVGPTGVWDWFGWTGNDELVIGDHNSNSVSSYSAAADRLERWEGVGDSVASSANGDTLVMYTNDYPDAAPPITIVRNGTTQTIAVAGTASRAPVLAPDGSGIILYAPTGDDVLVIMRDL